MIAFAPRPELPRLEADEVHVWHCPPHSINDAAVGRAYLLLSPDEQVRARRYCFEEHRQRFVIWRATLRRLLAGYLGVNALELRFCYGQHGKPALESVADGWLRFSLSHSGGVCLYAFGRDRNIGVDVEQISQDLPVEHLVPLCFSPCEIAKWNAIPVQQQRELFFSMWTIKEALLKQNGVGISDSFQHSLSPDRANGCTLHSLSPYPGYSAAVAVQGSNFRVRIGEWDTSSDLGVLRLPQKVHASLKREPSSCQRFAGFVTAF